MGKKVIATCSNGQPVAPQVVKRTRVKDVGALREVEHYTKETPRSKLIADLFDYFSVIDVHDYYRQGVLALERHWKTNL